MKLKQLSSLCLFAASTLMVTSSAMAWESADGQHSTSASVALSTDYMWRGVSQTDNEPAISGSFDYGHASGFYAGTWASNVDVHSTHLEIDGYLGYANEIGDTGIGYDVGAMRYFYPGTDGEYDWNEVYAAIDYSVFSFKISHSEDVLASHEAATHYMLGFHYGLPMGVLLVADYAVYDFDDVDSTFHAKPVDDLNSTHEDYSIGLSKDLVGFNFDLTYFETLSDGKDATKFENDGSGSRADSRVVFTISKSL
jgi:uncharacterized protein (TIGR02001 family)